MGKVVFFIIVVAFGLAWGVILLNQNQPKNPNTPFSIASPTPAQELVVPNTVRQQTAPSATSVPQQQVQGEPIGPQAATVSATIQTTKGNIMVSLYGKESPNAVLNFVQKAKSNFYTNLKFHRVEDWVVQGGDPKGDGTGGGQMLTEINEKPFVVGSLGVARGSDIRISNDAQFFITKNDASWLNGQYANFGIVTEGMDVVNQIKIGDKILGITVE